MPKILDYVSFCENLKEVTSLKTFSKKNFHSEGLFSEQIFGPIKNYTCQCGTYYGISKEGGKCDLCGVDIVNSDERRKRFAKIKIPIPVVNPIMYDLVVDLGGKNLKKAIDDLMKNEKSVLYMNNEEFIVTTTDEEIPTNVKKYERAEAIYKLVSDISDDLIEDGEVEWKVVKDNIQNLLISDVIVLPPDLRPVLKDSNNSSQRSDRINTNYREILTRKEAIMSTMIDIQKDKNLYYTYFRLLQKDINELHVKILEKLAKKEGLIRGNILGKRIDFSGRAVIAPDPTLNLDECKLPYIMILEIFKLQIAKKILQLGKFKLLNKAIDYVDECIENHSLVLYKVCETVIENEYCILNRQPSLHRLSMLGFKIGMTTDDAIKIHPLACNPFNADFDGDQMAVYIPITEEAKKEIKEKILITNNLNSPSNESLTTIPSQDIIIGVYYLTSPDFIKADTKFTYKNCEMSWGQYEFNKQLPEDYKPILQKIGKKELILILNDIKNNYSENETMKVLDNIKKVGFKYATLFGCTMSLKDCYNSETLDLKKSIYSNKDIKNQLAAISDSKIIDHLKENFHYSFMIESGARGSWDQVKQLVFSRGFISNFDGEILPYPIVNSLIEGLTQEEFFYSTYGCRKGLLDVALNTGASGYLSRKLIFTCANLQIDNQLEDCGTTDLLEIYVKNRRKAQMLVNKYHLVGKELKLITIENCDSLVGTTIYTRSPILCKSPKICKKCYGDLHKTLNSRFVGVIAAQTLGERGTQLVLRTFHTSGSAVIKGIDDESKYMSMKQKDIIGDLASVSRMLHKFDKKTYTQIVDELFDAYDKDIYHVHYECVVAQLMWKDSRKWRLLEDREKIQPHYYSIQSVPSQESWVLSMAFSNPKRSIINGILNEGKYSGVMDKILKGELIK